ncbi:tRNA dihydrouridine synthase DusB [Fimbriiglobus ruber]|uniref:tRNA-dihydrouridine synthase n=1 Tax=Fimbriiglobus ruber TaxID=1908690 RepID=A0A225DLD0_9BACT|nr:tRNA dihydrouridine synthase DusB [Fimbriiglobus ruber]OWK36977.1 tRNA dihydrouridine synthase B [Fimbriiglobus ruber]
MSTTSAPDLPAPPAHYRESLSIGPVRLASRFTLAPLAGYTNYPFRRSVREAGGVGLCTTDLVNARAILEGSSKTMDLLATGPDDRPLSVQIFGGNPREMAGAAKFLQDYGATVVDINMGCPVRKVVRVGGGSALMCDTTGTTIKLVQDVVEAVKIPVTVKMRLGWDDENHSAPYFAREFERVGVAAVTVHGRTRAQGFLGSVNRTGIRAVVEAVDKIPVFGNGDIMSVADAAQMIEETGCHGIAIGRGALANPWFFRQLTSWVETGDPGPRVDYYARIDFMGLHLRRLCEWRKEEKFGCVGFRKVAAWYAKALRTPKEIKHQLTMLNSLAEFDAIADRLREAGPPPGWSEWDAREAQIAVPTGPIAHW